MKRKNLIKKVFIAFGVGLILIQFIRINKENPVLTKEQDFITISKPSEEVSQILQNACYDCHSNESKYPWYTNVAPVSWWVKHHINEGREHLNFSIWGTYSAKRTSHKLEECVEEVKEGEMPMKTYTWMHKEAKLTENQKSILIDYFNSLISKPVK